MVYAVTTFIMAASVITFFKEIGRIERLSESLVSKMEELVELDLKNQELRRENDYYSTPEGIADLARRKYNLAMPGEKFYKIVIYPTARTFFIVINCNKPVM
jgi:cell division protein FtsB